MSIKNSRSILLASWDNVSTGTIRDNNSKIITPALMRTAVTDLYDTLATSHGSVADITALNALSLGTDFKEIDTEFVNNIGKGDKIGVYNYIRNRGTGNFGWTKTSELGESTKKILSSEATLQLFIDNDWSDSLMAIGYFVVISTGAIYLMHQNDGDDTGDYQLIYPSGGMNWADPVDAHIVPATDATYDLGSTTKGFRDLYFPATGTDGGIFAGTKEIARFSNATTEQLIINPAADFSGGATNPSLAISQTDWGFYMSDVDNWHFSADGVDLMTWEAVQVTIHGDIFADNVGAESTSVASSATPSPIGDKKENEYYLTALAVGATFAVPSGSPVNGNTLFIRIEDNGTARALAWNAIYRPMSEALPTTTVLGKLLYIGFVYNSTDSKWDCIGINQEA